MGSPVGAGDDGGGAGDDGERGRMTVEMADQVGHDGGRKSKDVSEPHSTPLRELRFLRE